MPVANDGGGGYGGTAPPGGLCQISVDDLIAYVGTLWTDVANLKTQVAALIATNIAVTDLSDLSGSLGNVVINGNGIPPTVDALPGQFTGLVLNSGVVMTVVDGVVTFQITPADGVTVGTGIFPTALFQMSGGAIAAGPAGTDLTFTTITGQSFATNASTYIALASGLYLLTISSGVISRTSTTAATTLQGLLGSNVSSAAAIGFGASWDSGETTISERYWSGALVASFPDGLSNSNVYGFLSKSGSPTVIAGPSSVSISKIG